MQTAKITQSGEMLSVQAPYNASLISEIKELPGRKWDAANKAWLVPAEQEAALRTSVRKYYQLEDEGRESAPETEERRVLVTGCGSSKRTYLGGVSVDGEPLFYSSGGLRKQSNAFEIIDYSGGYTSGDGYSHGDHFRAYTAQYEIKIRTRRDAEWEVTGRASYQGSFRFLDEQMPASEPNKRFDIEIADASVLSPAAQDIEIEEA